MILKPVSINSDISLKSLSAKQASYILNQKRNERGEGKNTDIYANDQLAVISKPGGESYGVGYLRDEQTQELYLWHWNSLGIDFITRTTGTTVEKVYEGKLNLSIDPKHGIWPWRAFLIYDRKKNAKYLIWTDGQDEIKCLDVELSILTDSFSANYFDTCTPNKRILTLLDVAQPISCITATIDTTGDPFKKNSIQKKAFQFRYKWLYYDQRESEWSPISTTYFIEDQTCYQIAGTRCFDLRISVGPSFVVGYVLAFRNDNSSTWNKYDVIERFGPYSNNTQEWFEREQILDFDTEACFFHYKFCGDKSCDLLDPIETNRVINPKPLTAQCLVPIDNRLTFINVERGMEKMPQLEKDKVTFTIENPVQRDCSIEYVEIKVSAVIHMPTHNRNQPIYQLDSSKDGTAHFGGINPKFNGGFEIGYEQNFSGDRKNFIVYLDDGSNNYNVELEQFEVRGQTVSKVGVLKNMDKASSRNAVRSLTRNGGYYRQQGTIKVPKGTKGFLRINSHLSAGSESTTSASVMGVWNGVIPYNGGVVFGVNGGGYTTGQKEIYFNACSGNNIDLTNNPFLIMDGAIDLASDNTASSNYLYGYVKDRDGVPIQGAIVTPLNIGNAFYYSPTTDHNGFYFVFYGNEINSINFKAETSFGVFDTIGNVPGRTGRKGSSTRYDVEYEEESYDLRKYFVQVRILDCTGLPLQGIYVAVSGGRGSVSSINGLATIAVRNRGPVRLLKIVVMQGSCPLRGCDDSCNPCMADYNMTLPTGFTGQTNDFGTVSYKAINNIKYGLKPGGRYELALIMHGNGNTSFAQVNDWGLNIPTYQELAGFSFSRISVNISSALVLPPEITHISLARTKNLNFRTYLEWSIDEIEYINSAGVPASPSSATYVRLTIQSLNDYNENYFFKSNTKYQYVDGDRCEFITKKGGKLFTSVINLPVISPFANQKGVDTPADFFNQIIVPFDTRLLDLDDGCIISLQNPYDCETKRTYQEICGLIPINNFNGKLLIPTFDTYRVSRLVNKQIQQFDHHSITDFWGSVDDQGRLFTSNIYERRSKLPRDMMITESWNLFGTRNGANIFSTEVGRVKTFQGWEMGDITAAKINDASLLTVICENDFFSSMVGDDFLRRNTDGTIRSNPSEQIVSNPQLKLGEKLGCQYNDIGSVYFGSGFATWFDSNKGMIGFTDYQQGADVSEGKIRFFIKRVAEYLKGNSALSSINKVRFITGFDPLNNWVLLTVKKIRQSGIYNSYVSPIESDNFTIAFDPVSKDFPTYLSFTPEIICNMENNTFISVLGCQPYIHEENQKVNEFFGVPCDRVVIISANENLTKKKRYIAIEIQSDSGWLSPLIVSDKSTFVSEIPAVKFKRNGEKYNAPFLRDKNSLKGLYQGPITEGYFCGITLVKDNTINSQYQTFSAIKRTTMSESDFIFVSYTEVEKSGQVTQKQ